MEKINLCSHVDSSIYRKLYNNGISVFLLEDKTRLIIKDNLKLSLKPTTPYVVAKNLIEETFKIKL